MLPLLVDTGFQELFHSSARGAFHLSLTVLVHYRSPGNIALEGGPPGFKQDFSCPVLLRYRLGHLQTFAYGGLTLYAVPSQTLQLILQLYFVGGPTTPTGVPGGLGSSAFARRY